jgi:hypothetical protein
LIKIADLDGDLAVLVRKRTQVSDMTIAADSDREPFRKRALRGSLQPFVELDRISPNIGMGRTRHLFVARVGKHLRTFLV